jgi:hypothetical protein
MKTRSFVFFTAIALAAALPVCAEEGSHCQDVAGVLMTDIYAIAPGQINLGPAFGDLGGAVSAQIVGQNSDGSFNIQHYWISTQGDVIKFQQAVLHPVYPIANQQWIVSVPWGSYLANIIPGGTGKWANAKGFITCFGMADFKELTLVLRYRGRVCFNNEPTPPAQ